MSFQLEIELYYSSGLADGAVLGHVARTLASLAPKWNSSAHVYHESELERLHLEKPGELARLVFKDKPGTGPVYNALTEKYGVGDERTMGGTEFRSADKSLILIVWYDDYLASFSGEVLLLGNSITLQICRTKVEKQDAGKWAETCFRQLCSLGDIWHGFAGTLDEYDSKNMDFSEGMCAIGRDYSRALPGLYWLNYFGGTYLNAMGADNVLNAPAAEVQRIQDGALVKVFDNPRDWDSAGSIDTQKRVVDHLGRQFFFDRARGYTGTVTPDLHQLKIRRFKG